MVSIKPQYITDAKGNKLSVILTIEEFDAIMEQIAELEDIMLYEQAKKNDDASIPIEEAFQIIEAKRNAV